VSPSRAIRAVQGAAPAAFTFAALGLLWQFVAAHQRSILPSLGAVASDLVVRPGFYATNLGVTLGAALFGFVIGGVVAIALAILFIHFPRVRSALFPVALLINVTPIVAISPALIVAFGFNMAPHVIVSAVAAFFPVLVNAMTGLQAVDAQAMDVFRSMAASRTEVFFHLRLPTSLPHLFSGARLSIAAAMVGSIVSEFTGTSQGLGAAIVMSTTYLNLAQLWAAIFVSAAITFLMIRLVDLAETLIVRW
jgi:NitT/TauT family transport system permease protein